jgi:hypothetical protein
MKQRERHVTTPAEVEESGGNRRLPKVWESEAVIASEAK